MRFFLLNVLFLSVPTVVLAAGDASVELKFQQSDLILLYASLGLSIVAILFGWGFARWVLKQDPGSEKMQEVSEAIQQGAKAYLRRQIRTMSVFIVILAVGLFFLYHHNEGFKDAKVYGIPVALLLSASFVMGVLASYIAGYVGMIMAVKSNARVAHAALTSYKRSLELAFRAGSVAGLITVGMGLLGATLIFLFAREHAMKLLIGFGFGGSLAALFMRVGGGIYTKAADVGADLVGKVEAGIPEDDPRNAATIADNVGDNVGDCAGMAADVFESYEVTLVAAIILGAATALIFDQATWMKLILFALMARGVGIVASIIGVFMVRGKDDEKLNPLAPISKGFMSSAALAAIGTFVLAYFMMQDVNVVSYRDYSGEQYGGLTLVDKRRAQVVGAISQLEFRESVIPAGQPEPDKKVADKTDEELAKDVNDILQQDYQRIVSMNPEMADKIQPPKEVSVDEIKAARKDALLNYTLISDNRVWGPLIGALGPMVANEPVLAKVKISPGSFPNQPPSEPIEMWQRYDKLSLENLKQGGSVEVIEEVPLALGVSRDGSLMWVVGMQETVTNATSTWKPTGKVTDKDALLNALNLSYTRIKVDRGNNPMVPTLVQPDGIIGTVAAETRQVEWWRFSLALFFGIVMAFLIERLTDYFVSFEKRPVKEVAASSSAGPAPMIIQGFAFGMESSVWAVFAIVVSLITPLFIFPPELFGGFILSFYGIALVGLGLLTTTGYILAMDTFGPISDNSQGVYEMSGAKHNEVVQEGSLAGSKAVQRLDAAGNTTKALTKGFAIATAVVAAVALFHSYVEDANLAALGLRLETPQIFIGLLIGGAAPFLFSAFSINAVGRASFQLIEEVRRQFKADPGILAGTSKPDYGRCVEIVTKAAQTELLGPGILAIALPALVAFGLSIGQPTTKIGGMEFNLVGAQALGGFLAGAILSGQLLAVLLANSGGLWDNAKKTIEDGLYGGKGSEAHKAGVVCDTVGDPFKDTAGPALNPLIKVMNLVALILVPVVIAPLSQITLYIVSGACVIALGIAVFWSKRGSIGTEIAKTTGES